MAVHSKVWEQNKDLMVTYTTDYTKTLHKVGTEEYYDDPIDLICGVYGDDTDRAGEPMCKFEYEEVDKPEEKGEPESDPQDPEQVPEPKDE